MSKYSGYTQLPNIFDALMPYLSEGEFKILYHIARQTIGFHKEKDRLSFTQLQKATGLTRDTVGRSLINLKVKSLIKVSETFEYQLDTDSLLVLLDKLEISDTLDDIDSLKIRPVKYGKKKVVRKTDHDGMIDRPDRSDKQINIVRITDTQNIPDQNKDSDINKKKMVIEDIKVNGRRRKRWAEVDQ